jgi:cysteine desulfurase
MHRAGQKARLAVEQARQQIASLLQADPDEVVFTSGGTESDNLAVKGLAMAVGRKGDHILCSSVEHHAVLEPCRFLAEQGFRVTHLPVDSAGRVDPDDVKRSITDRTILISVMHANNETGMIQPLKEISRIARRQGICFHTDAVQSFGHIPTDVVELGVDLLSASAHKLYGPKGVGILYVRKGNPLVPLLHGGMQERGLRASTYNVPAIVGMGEAAATAQTGMAREQGRLRDLRNGLAGGLSAVIDGLRLNGEPEQTLPGHLNVSIEGVDGEGLVLNLDMAGISCSTGSACTSLDLEPSHVLLSMGLPRTLALSSVRFSLGKSTVPEDLERVLEIMPAIVKKLRTLAGRSRKAES